MDNHFARYFSGLSTDAHYIFSYSLVRENILNGFFTFDRNWTVKYCNSVAESLMGDVSGGILGKNLWTEMDTVIPPEFYEVVRRSFLNESPDHFEEYPGVMGNWFDVILYHCNNMISVSFKSLHQRARLGVLQQQLLRLNELYRAVTEITNDCLWEQDLETAACI